MILTTLLIFTYVNANVCPAQNSREMYHGLLIPSVGFGTAAIGRHEFVSVIEQAFEAGFRHFDGAEAVEWYNDEMLSFAMRGILEREASLKREDIFLTTKIHPRNFGWKRFNESMAKELNLFHFPPTKYIDLVLLHFKQCYPHICTAEELVQFEEDPELWIKAYNRLEDYFDEGKIKSLGVSNFNANDLNFIISNTIPHGRQLFRYLPHVVQNYPDINLDADVISLCQSHGIIYTAYSAFGRLLNEPTLQHRGFTRESLIHWAKTNKLVLLPRSTNPVHIKQNAQLILEL